MDWIYLTQVRDQSQSVLKMSMKIRIPENVEESLSRFSGRTLLS
jgi:hypothetical protein